MHCAGDRPSILAADDDCRPSAGTSRPIMAAGSSRLRTSPDARSWSHCADAASTRAHCSKRPIRRCGGAGPVRLTRRGAPGRTDVPALERVRTRAAPAALRPWG